jgi:hypothetical protein
VAARLRRPLELLSVRGVAVARDLRQPPQLLAAAGAFARARVYHRPLFAALAAFATAGLQRLSPQQVRGRGAAAPRVQGPWSQGPCGWEGRALARRLTAGAPQRPLAWPAAAGAGVWV